MAASTHLVIADDHPLFRDALRQAVASVVASAKIDADPVITAATALAKAMSRLTASATKTVVMLSDSALPMRVRSIRSSACAASHASGVTRDRSAI